MLLGATLAVQAIYTVDLASFRRPIGSASNDVIDLNLHTGDNHTFRATHQGSSLSSLHGMQAFLIVIIVTYISMLKYVCFYMFLLFHGSCAVLLTITPFLWHKDAQGIIVQKCPEMSRTQADQA